MEYDMPEMGERMPDHEIQDLKTKLAGELNREARQRVEAQVKAAPREWTLGGANRVKEDPQQLMLKERAHLEYTIRAAQARLENLNSMRVASPMAAEAHRLVTGEREDQYGKAEDSFEAIGDAWTGILKNKLAPFAKINALDVALAMAALKLVRETNQRKRDNIVDAHGYVELAGRIAGHE